MPPKPRTERFPPTRLLLEISRKEEQPARSPWWLTALRLLLAAIVIFALAGPVFKPTAEVAPGTGDLLTLLRAARPDIIIVDLDLPDRDSIEQLATVTDERGRLGSPRRHVAAVACLLPARRATQIQPIAALRSS